VKVTRRTAELLTRLDVVGVEHVIWDWNGTLLDDFDVIIEATSVTCRDFLGRPVSPEEYRTHFARPVQLLYERLLGRPITLEEWAHLTSTFHESYRRLVTTAALATDAEIALRTVRGAGQTQSLLSMWFHDDLVPMVETLGLGPDFVRIDGLQVADEGDSKHQHLVAHLDALSADLGRELAGERVLLVGDSLDDAAAALAAGTTCVLVEGGSHHPEDLAGSGVPVAASLIDALKVGGALD